MNFCRLQTCNFDILFFIKGTLVSFIFIFALAMLFKHVEAFYSEAETPNAHKTTELIGSSVSETRIVVTSCNDNYKNNLLF